MSRPGVLFPLETRSPSVLTEAQESLGKVCGRDSEDVRTKSSVFCTAHKPLNMYIYSRPILNYTISFSENVENGCINPQLMYPSLWLGSA